MSRTELINDIEELAHKIIHLLRIDQPPAEPELPIEPEPVIKKKRGRPKLNKPTCDDDPVCSALMR
jgi:hypothetical protein